MVDETVKKNDDANIIDTGAGDDAVTAAAGADAIDAGAGDDTIVAQSGDGDDIIDGGEGTDTLDMSAIDADVTVDLDAATARSADTGNDVVTNVENVVTGSGDDTIVGSDDANVIVTGAGNDTVTAAAGACWRTSWAIWPSAIAPEPRRWAIARSRTQARRPARW